MSPRKRTEWRTALGNIATKELSVRLEQLLGEDRDVLVELLLHLGEFERRRGWQAFGYANLWRCCEKKLGFFECAISRSTHAAPMLREYPFAEEFLRRQSEVDHIVPEREWAEPRRS